MGLYLRIELVKAKVSNAVSQELIDRFLNGFLGLSSAENADRQVYADVDDDSGNTVALAGTAATLED